MKKVFCPGEALIDLMSYDKNGSLIETELFKKKAGGAPANVAGAISKLGLEAYFCGSVGADQFGQYLENTLNENLINTELLFKLEDKNTTLAFVSLADNGERDFVFFRGADEYLDFNLIEDRLNDFDLYHFGSATAFMGGSLKETYYKLKDYAIKANKKITFDANYRENLFADKKHEFVECCKDFIKVSNIVKLSEEEAYLISGKDSVKEAADYIFSLGCESLLITLGKKGTFLTTKEKQVLVPTKEVKMKDATGAGDAFMGAVIVEVLKYPQKDIEDIVSFANIVGGITTTKIGALESIPTYVEVEKYCKEHLI